MSRIFDSNTANYLQAAASLAADRTDFTLMAWIKPPAVVTGGTKMAVVMNHAFNNPRLQFSGSDLDPTLARLGAPGADATAFTEHAMTRDGWNIVIGRVDSAGADPHIIRTNGGLATNGTAAAPMASANVSFVRIGSGDGLDPAEGKIAHVAMWNRALTLSEMQALEGGANPLTIEGSRLFYYPLTDSSLTNAFTPDNSDTAGTLTVNGTVAVDAADNPTVDAPPGVSTVPTISGIAPTTATPSSNLAITGTNFEATQGTGVVTVSPTDNVADAAAVTATIATWSATSIATTGTPFPTGTAHDDTLYVFVTNDTGETNAAGFQITAYLAPSLESPTQISIGATTVTPRVTTDSDNGTLYFVLVLQSETRPTNTQIAAGHNADGVAAIRAGSTTVTVAGVQTFPEQTGLSAITPYTLCYAHNGVPPAGP